MKQNATSEQHQLSRSGGRQTAAHVFCRCVILIFAFAGALTARAENPGDEVVVVFNSRMPESRSVADYYARLRHVPTNQVFGFEFGANDVISRTEFETDLQRPLAKLLQEGNLWRLRSEIIHATNGRPAHVLRRVQDSKIRYLLLCYGVPYRIKEDPTLKEPETEDMRPELRRNEAAVDSELATLPCIEQHLPLAGPLRNPLYTVTNRFLFSPTNGVLIVARLDGPSAGIARGLVDKAIAAEKDGLWGRGYFDLRNVADTNYALGDNWIRAAAECCRFAGFDTVIDENPATFPAEFPMSQIAFYCGWYDANLSGPFTRTNVEFMPGAFAYHLHSYSAANPRSTTENWVGPMLAKGATITMGSVAEPYLSGTPDVSVFVARLIFFGFSFGEAACAAQSVLSWQTTVIGDPLYRPFARPPQELHADLERRHSKLIEWSYLRLANLNLVEKRLPLNAVVNFLEQLEPTKTSAALTEKLADLYSAQGKPSTAVATYESALKLGPSPQQKVRLRLVLAEKLSAASRGQEAYYDLRALLAENPDYPDGRGLLEKLQGLALQIGNKDEIARCAAELKRFAPATPQKNLP